MENHEVEQATAITTQLTPPVPLETEPPAVVPPQEPSQPEGAVRDRIPSGAGKKTEAEKPLIDVREFAAKVGCCPKHIRRMADSGRCPPSISLGGLRRWNRKVVDKWIADGCPVVRHVRINGRK